MIVTINADKKAAIDERIAAALPDPNGDALDARQLSTAKEDASKLSAKIADPHVQAAIDKILEIIT